MKRLIVAFLTLTILIGMQTGADAHNAKGRMKILLKKDVIAVNDMAYYIKPYVHKKKYKGKYKKNKSRFYVKDFIKVKQKKESVDVFFTVLDVKENRTFEDSMAFTRNRDGTWFHIDEEGRKIAQVYAYVDKKSYYYKKYVLPGSRAGMVLAGIFIFFRVRKRLNKNLEPTFGYINYGTSRQCWWKRG